MSDQFRLRRIAAACTAVLAIASFAHAGRAPQKFLPPELSACQNQVPVTANVPPNGAPIPDPAAGEFSNGFFHVQEIARDFYYATDGTFQSAFVVSRQGIIAIDAPPMVGFNALEPARSVSIVDVIYSVPATRGLKIRKLIYSHSHLDHIGQASKIVDAFPDVEIIAQQETAEKIARGTGEQGSFLPNAGRVPPPRVTRIFRRATRVRLGDKELRLSYRGPVHDPGNIFIHAPRQRVLMLVDVLFPGSSQFTDLNVSVDLPLFVKAFDRILEFDFDIFVGGHNNRLGLRADVVEGRRYVQDMVENARRALQDQTPAAIFGILPRNQLAAAAIFSDEQACKCANLTLDPTATPSRTDWRGRLTAADLLTVTHCSALVEALRIDPSF
jgi:glyoxylase-like metal-dependent hydrolase (beta-lactamase superfamily II)